MKKITFFTSVLAILLIGILYYVFWDEHQEEIALETNINKGLPDFPKNNSTKSDSCLWLWYSSTTLYKACANQNGNITISYGSRKWHRKLNSIFTKMYFVDGDFNLNNSPEIYLFGLTSKGYVVQAFELQQEQLHPFALPPLMGTNLFGYRGNDSLYFEKNLLVRQFLTNYGQKVCYYELMPNLQYELRLTKTL